MLDYIMNRFRGLNHDGSPECVSFDGHRVVFSGRWWSGDHYRFIDWLDKKFPHQFRCDNELNAKLDAWLAENATDLWYNLHENNKFDSVVYLKSERDAVLFKMYWK